MAERMSDFLSTVRSWVSVSLMLQSTFIKVAFSRYVSDLSVEDSMVLMHFLQTLAQWQSLTVIYAALGMYPLYLPACTSVIKIFAGTYCLKRHLFTLATSIAAQSMIRSLAISLFCVWRMQCLTIMIMAS